MNGNVCREVRQEIDNSELRQSFSAGSEAHLSVCAACATFRDERARLRELVGGLQPVTAPADFEMRLRARIARERDLPKQPFIFRFVMSTPAIAVAAVVVIAVSAAVFINQNRRSNSTVASEKKVVTVPPVTPIPIVSPTDSNPPSSDGAMADNNGGEKIKHSNGAVKNFPKLVADMPLAVDLNTRSAQQVRMIDPAGGVSLTAPMRPMVVTMYDEHGGTRKIQLPPISFGSQRLTDSRVPASMTNTKDW